MHLKAHIVMQLYGFFSLANSMSKNVHRFFISCMLEQPNVSGAFTSTLNTLDTFGDSQIPVFSVGVSKHLRIKITSEHLRSVIDHRPCRKTMKEKTPLLHIVFAFR